MTSARCAQPATDPGFTDRDGARIATAGTDNTAAIRDALSGVILTMIAGVASCPAGFSEVLFARNAQDNLAPPCVQSWFVCKAL